MAATDKTYRSQRTLDVVFAVSCLLMLASTVWMLVVDYNREFKTVQRTFRDVESVLNERQMLAQLPDPAEVKTLQEEVAAKKQAVDEARKQVAPQEQRLTAERDERTAAFRSIKADFDSKSSLYNIAVEERDQAGISDKTRQERAERVKTRREELDRLQHDLDEAQKAVDQAEADYKAKVTDPVADAQNKLADAEDAEKKVAANFDRFAKLTVQKQWGLGDAFRALPILDAFESPTKIKQIVLNDLPIEYGSFKYVTRYDRCASCHLAIDRATFDHDTLTALTRDDKAAREAMKQAAMTASNELAALAARASDDDRNTADANLAKVKALLDSPRKLEGAQADDPYAVYNGLAKVLSDLRGSDVPGTAYGPVDEQVAQVKALTDQYEQAKLYPQKLETARRILQARKDKGESLGFEPGDLPSQARTVGLTSGQITEYAAHLRLDLFVDSNSPHPMEKFGCTICHAGQGSATDFELADHTPADASQRKQWEEAYHWHANHDWEFPMLSSRFVESSCLKCHYEVTDLVRQGSKEEAPKLLRGFNLVRENGCFGCHEIAGIKGGREVGPDLRLEPTPPLDWLTPTDQTSAKADPTNPPGAYRKVGPSLRRIVEKTNEEWARRWIQSPRGFRPDTKMPHFYNLSNNDLAGLEATAKKDKDGNITDRGQMDFPAAEIHSIAHYLFTESGKEFTESADHKTSEAKDAYRVGLEDRLKELQDRLKEAPLEDKDRKELRDVTRRLADVALLSMPAGAAAINDATGRLRQAQERIIELYEKQVPKNEGGPGDTLSQEETDEMARSKKDLAVLAGELEAAGNPVPVSRRIVDSEGEPVTEPLPEADKNDLAKHTAEGRRLFSERGCLACHVHDAVREKGADGAPALTAEAANFAPDLSRIAAKIAPQNGDAKARRRWLVQWVLNPNIHHPRTRMPITHLTVPQACDVADWLLSQEVKPEELEGWEKDPKAPEVQTLVALARVYLAKAPGMTSAKVDAILPPDAAEIEKVSGYSEDDLKYTARDADERVLAAPVTKDKLEWYIGRKGISRMGCYACHDVPGFETAKPIGTALNDWGKKDAERLAFEDADAYVRGHYNIVKDRNAPGDPRQAAPDWHAKDGKPPYEELFYDALEHHSRGGFLHQKLEDPRSYDFNRLRAWDDRLRMPQFRFGRSRRHAGETDEAYQVRQELEEAEAREAVMTFILGLVAEPIPLKFVNSPSPDRLAEARGHKVLDKYNCVGCHQVRPGVYEFRPTKETLDALEHVYQNYEANAAKKDHVFPGHNAWTGAGSPWPDRLVAHGTQAHVADDENANRDLLNLRLSEALRFTNNDHVTRDIPAGMTAKLVPEDVFQQSPPYGGAFGDLLIPYLAQSNSTLFGNKPDEARAVLPPPLVREGERVQPRWLYQFLLDPQPVRPPEKMKLRMPKFNMSGEDAMTLVNYFGAADRLGNPGAGLTTPYLNIEQTDPKYWRGRTDEYLKRLQELAGPDGKGLDQRAKDLLTQMEAGLKLRLDAAKAAAMSAQGDDKAKKEQEAKDLQGTIDKWDKQIKDGDCADLLSQWKSREAYAADAYRLIAANPNICSKCHSVGSLKVEGANGPDLSIAFERLRPEWTLEWISNPDRMFAYAPTMPQNFPKDSVDYKEFLAGDPRDRARAARDVLMDLPRLENLPADRATRSAITGGK